MKTFVITLATAGTIAFGALNLAAAASATPAQSYQPTGTLTALHAPFAEAGGRGADRREDRRRERVQRDRFGLSSPGLGFGPAVQSPSHLARPTSDAGVEVGPDGRLPSHLNWFSNP
jgi:hypothetical protein